MAEKFENLKVWQLSHSLALRIYSITSEFPSEERFGLTSQLRRSATSVAANIVEGCCRQGDSEFKRFLNIARGSCGETIYHLILAKDLSFLYEGHYASLRAGYEEVSRMLNGLVSSLRSQQTTANS
jgi:four helix bundle protein